MVRIRETLQEIVGKNNSFTCDCCYGLGAVRSFNGDYAGAEKEFAVRLACLEELGLQNSLIYANDLRRLGQVVLARRDKARAGKLLQQSWKSLEKNYGPDHKDTLSSQWTWAQWLESMGDYERAYQVYFDLTQAYKRKMGSVALGDSLHSLPDIDGLPKIELLKPHLQYAEARSKMVKVQAILGKEVNTERALLQYANVLEKVRGRTHPTTVSAWGDLAWYYYMVTRLDLAERYCRQALETIAAHPEVDYRMRHPWILLVLSAIYRDQGQFEEVERVLRQRQELVLALFGRFSGAYRHGLDNLIVALAAQGRQKEALALAQEMFELEQVELRHVLGFASENSMQVFVEQDWDTPKFWINLVAEADNPSPDEIEALWTSLLQSKGVLLDTLCRFREGQVEMANNKQFADQVQSLRQLRDRMNRLTLHPPRGISEAQLKRDRGKLQTEIAGLERRLREQLDQDRPTQKGESEALTLARVRRHLPADTTLIELVRYQPFDWKLPRGKRETRKPRYLAFVVNGKNGAKPRLIDLGEADVIDRLTLEVRDHIEKVPDALGSIGEKLLETEYQPKAKALYAKLLQPLEEALQGSKTLLIVPDGDLHHLPFAALVDTQGKYVIESYQCAYLSSSRDLLRPKSSRVGQGVVVFGDPDYDLGVQARIEQTAKLTKSDKGQALTVRGPLLKTRGGTTWNRLQATGPEAKAIEELLSKAGWVNIDVYLRERALEEVLKRVRSPQILHLGTHAEFVKKETPGVERRRSPSELGTEARLGRFENPLLRSYLVLAGGNHPDETESGKVRVEDGLLTAEEAALLHLHGTELVVLSACKSGLGDVRGSEGVYGLRRAFLYAGARTLVTTLFSVPSQESMGLMKTFYAGLASGTSKLEALHHAQLETIHARRKSEAGAAHPFFGASYSLIGETGPLTVQP